MADPFGYGVEREWIDQIIAACLMYHRHTFFLLTKRPQFFQAYLQTWKGKDDKFWLPSNLWLGVSIERPFFTWRLSYLNLIKTISPGLKTFVSIEPILEEIDLAEYLPKIGKRCWDGATCHHNCVDECWRKESCGPLSRPDPMLDWVMIGKLNGATGELAKREWVQKIVDQCKTGGVPVFEKNSLSSLMERPLIQELPK
jgi:protein gp37